MTDSKRKKRPRDANQLAKFIVDVATGEEEDDNRTISEKRRDAGVSGGKARASVLGPSKRKEIARAAAKKRWSDKT